MKRKSLVYATSTSSRKSALLLRNAQSASRKAVLFTSLLKFTRNSKRIGYKEQTSVSKIKWGVMLSYATCYSGTATLRVEALYLALSTSSFLLQNATRVDNLLTQYFLALTKPFLISLMHLAKKVVKKNRVGLKENTRLRAISTLFASL